MIQAYLDNLTSYAETAYAGSVHESVWNDAVESEGSATATVDEPSIGETRADIVSPITSKASTRPCQRTADVTSAKESDVDETPTDTPSLGILDGRLIETSGDVLNDDGNIIGRVIYSKYSYNKLFRVAAKCDAEGNIIYNRNCVGFVELVFPGNIEEEVSKDEEKSKEEQQAKPDPPSLAITDAPYTSLETAYHAAEGTDASRIASRIPTSTAITTDGSSVGSETTAPIAETNYSFSPSVSDHSVLAATKDSKMITNPERAIMPAAQFVTTNTTALLKPLDHRALHALPSRVLTAQSDKRAKYTFKWERGGANKVNVVGRCKNWNKWQQLDKVGDVFEKTVVFTSSGKILYQFVVDDKWVISHTAATETDEQGIVNNVIHPHDLTPIPSQGFLDQSVQVIQRMLAAWKIRVPVSTEVGAILIGGTTYQKNNNEIGVAQRSELIRVVSGSALDQPGVNMPFIFNDGTCYAIHEAVQTIVRTSIALRDHVANSDRNVFLRRKKVFLRRLDFLLQCGANLTVQTGPAANRFYRLETPLQMAFRNWDVALEVIEKLLDAGAPIKGEPNLRRTLLDVPKGSLVDVAKFLVSRGIDINEASKGGYTLLHDQNNVDLIAFLVANGADINAQANPRWFYEDRADFDANLPPKPHWMHPEGSRWLYEAGTPLHIAVQKAKLETIKTLLDFGANPNIKSECRCVWTKAFQMIRNSKPERRIVTPIEMAKQMVMKTEIRNEILHCLTNPSLAHKEATTT
jgi:hypothetical protein